MKASVTPAAITLPNATAMKSAIKPPFWVQQGGEPGRGEVGSTVENGNSLEPGSTA